MDFEYYLAAMTPSVFSVVFSVKMIFSCCKTEKKSCMSKLVLALSICNLFFSLSMILPSYKYEELCVFQGILHIYFQNLGCDTHALIAFALYLSFNHNEYQISKLCRRIFIGFLIVILPSAIYPTVNDKFGYAGGWCTIYKDNSQGVLVLCIYLFMRYFFVWSSIFYVAVAYFLIANRYKETTKNIENTKLKSSSITKKMIKFPLALFFVYFPIQFERAYSEFYTPNKYLAIVCIAINSLIGVVNYLVYRMSFKSERSLSFKPATINSSGLLEPYSSRLKK